MAGPGPRRCEHHRSNRRRRLLAGERSPLRDAGRDPDDRRPRPSGRDDDGFGVHRRRRARPPLRGDLCGRQHGQRDRGRSAQRRRDGSGPRPERGPAANGAGDDPARPRRRGDGVTLTVLDARLDGEPVGLRCDEEGRIAALGPEVEAEPGDEIVAAGGAHLVAGLVNGHTHAAMTLFRGYGGDLPLMRWLEEKIWPVEARLEDDDVYWGTRLACAEMIRTGTTQFWDMYWHPRETARAVIDSGLRATIGAPLIDRGEDNSALREDAAASIEELSSFGGRVRPSLAPHAIYTVGSESLRFISEL